jgi:AsmA protein
MGRIIKYLLMVIGVFAALFVVVAITLYLFFDPNDFREDISRLVKNQTGRDLIIEGDISLQVFPWLAIEVGKSSLGNAPGFNDEPMLIFEKASLSVRLLPAILRQEVIVGAADIELMQLNLSIDEHGDINWADLAAVESSGASDWNVGPAGGIDINSIEVIDAKVTYTDKEAGGHVVLDNINLTIGRLSDGGSALPITGEMNFDAQPSGLVGTIVFKSSMTYDGATSQLQLDDVSVDGTVEGVASIPTSLRMTTDSITVATSEFSVDLAPLDFTLLDMHIVAYVEPFSYADELTMTAGITVDAFSPRSIMNLFDVKAPVTADPAALSSVTINAQADLTAAALNLSDVAIKLDYTSFSGSLLVPRSSAGFYQFELIGDAINLDRYMEPTTEGEAATSGEYVPVEIRADLIAPLNARGKLKFSTATLGGFVFESVDFGLNTSKGEMRIFPITSDLFGGKYTGDVRIDVSGSIPRLSMNEKIQGVDLAKLAKAMFDQDNVTGTIGGNFVLSGRGADMTAIQRDLSGNVALQLDDGTYEGTDVWYELRRARALLKQDEAPTPELPAKTAFSTVSVTGVVSDGVIRSDDLYAELPFMQLSGGGSINLVEATIDYGLVARILQRSEFLTGAIAEELDEFTEAVIPLKITGAIDAPRIAPDLEKLLQQRVEEEIEDLLKDKLKGLFD